MNKGFRDWKVWAGIAVSIVFLFLAFHKVDFHQMAHAFTQANYWWLIPAILMLFFSHFLRAWRWQYLLAPVSKVKLGILFNSLLIGYMANTFLPAHLGEFLRAGMVSKKHPISGSSVFATVVIERIIDVFTLLTLMAVTIVIFPFPEWVKQSGYISFAFIAVLFVILVLMKKYKEQSLKITAAVLKPFPSTFQNKILDMLHQFIDGVVGLKSRKHYVIVFILSLSIWFCYGFIFQIGFYAFDFINIYDLPWKASLVLLVITTIAVLVPSSPGYVGTYHFLCQVSLGFFAVPDAEALTYAFVLHGLNFLPILIVGLILFSIEGLSFKKIQQTSEFEEKPA